MIWLLSVEIGGRLWRLSTAPASPVDGASVTYAHLPTLDDPEVSRSVGMGGQALGEGETRVRFTLPGVSLVALEASGVEVDGGEAELCLWEPGTAWEQRERVAGGRLALAGLALAGEVIEASIEIPVIGAERTVPLAEDVVLESDFPSYDVPTQSLGRAYLYIIGAVGSHVTDSGITAVLNAAEGVLIDTGSGTQRLMVAGHRVGATQAVIYVPSAAASPTDTFNIEYVLTARGRLVATVDVHTRAVSWDLTGASPLYVQSLSTALIDDDGATVRGLGQLIVWLLRQGDPDARIYDLDAWRGVAYLLDGITIAGAIEEPVAPWDLVSEQLLPLAPRVSAVPGPRGWMPVYLDDRPAGELLEVVEGQHFALLSDGLPELVGDGPLTGLRLTFAYDAVDGPAVDSSVIQGTPPTEAIGAWAGVARRVASYGAPPQEVQIEASWTADRASADAAAGETYLLGAERLPAVRVRVPVADRTRYPLGVGLRPTIATLGWVSRPCWVTGWSYSEGFWDLALTAQPRGVV